jgi:hypothetical protein
MSFLEGYSSCPKLFNTLAIPYTRYPKNTLGSITDLLKLEEYCITLPKPKKDALPSLGYTIKATV